MNTQPSIWSWAVGGVLLSGSLCVGIWGLSTTDVRADRDKHERHEYRDEDHEYARYPRQNRIDPIYVEECGSCHLAYPANMLAEDSWKAMMIGLENHFGESAELDPETQAQIQTYLVDHAADKGGYQSKRYLSSRSQATPVLRITELPYFIREHDEIPLRLVKNSDEIGSLSRCDACHQNAQQGYFDEYNVVIPGFGRWDD